VCWLFNDIIKIEKFLECWLCLSKTRNRQHVWSRERRKFDKSIYSLRGICSRRRSLNSVFSKLLTLDYRFIIINRSCAWFKNNWAFDINNKLFYTILVYTYIQHEKIYEENWYNVKKILQYKNKRRNKFVTLFTRVKQVGTQYIISSVLDQRYMYI